MNHVWCNGWVQHSCISRPLDKDSKLQQPKHLLTIMHRDGLCVHTQRLRRRCVPLRDGAFSQRIRARHGTRFRSEPPWRSNSQRRLLLLTSHGLQTANVTAYSFWLAATTSSMISAAKPCPSRKHVEKDTDAVNKTRWLT